MWRPATMTEWYIIKTDWVCCGFIPSNTFRMSMYLTNTNCLSIQDSGCVNNCHDKDKYRTHGKFKVTSTVHPYFRFVLTWCGEHTQINLSVTRTTIIHRENVWNHNETKNGELASDRTVCAHILSKCYKRVKYAFHFDSQSPVRLQQQESDIRCRLDCSHNTTSRKQ